MTRLVLGSVMVGTALAMAANAVKVTAKSDWSVQDVNLCHPEPDYGHRRLTGGAAHKRAAKKARNRMRSKRK